MKKRLKGSLWLYGIFLFGVSNMKAVDLDPELYHEHSSMQYGLAENQTRNLQLRGDEVVLDIGCGEGAITAVLGNKLKTGAVLGIDQSHAMIAYANKTYASKNISFICMDVDELDEEEKYDVITCFSAFHWFEHPTEAFSKIVKALKKGGTLYIVTYPAESPDWDYYKKALLSHNKWQTYEAKCIFSKILSSADYRQLASHHNLEIAQLDVEDDSSVHPDINDFKKYAKAWMPLFVPLPEAELDEYIDAVIEYGSSQFYYDKDNKLHVPFKKITMIFKKP